MKDGECRNWAELPYELTSSILGRLSTVDILGSAQKVCTTWRRVCKDPAMWRKIDMRDLGTLKDNLDIMCRHAVDCSQGGLLEIVIWHICIDSLLHYIADSSSNLRSLRLAWCSLVTDEGLISALVKLPLLEELEISCSSLSVESLKLVGQSCPNLKSLKLNSLLYRCSWSVSESDAQAIAETMPGLRFLQLFGNMLSDVGLNAILDNCPGLEHLDLRQCLNVNFVGDLEKHCSDRIKVLRRPNDSTHDYEYNSTFIDTDSSGDYYPEDYYPYDDDHENSDYDPYEIDECPHLYDIFSYIRF